MLTVVLPSAAPGILTGTILAVARAAGETAPLLVVDSLVDYSVTTTNPLKAMPNIPFDTFQLAESPVPGGFTRAWGAALVLVFVILAANIGAGVLLARGQGRMGQ